MKRGFDWIWPSMNNQLKSKVLKARGLELLNTEACGPSMVLVCQHATADGNFALNSKQTVSHCSVNDH